MSVDNHKLAIDYLNQVKLSLSVGNQQLGNYINYRLLFILLQCKQLVNQI